MNERDQFIAAVQIEDPAERAAYLDKACGGDAELRRRVEALLAALGQAGSFLQQPAAGVAATAEACPVGPPLNSTPVEGPGMVIGPYKLLQQIGEGGMGTVFMAEQQQPVRRKVALKVIKPGMDTRQVIVRFEAERQALAMMDHVNIARVLDAGATESGRPYFVMELVHGVPITKYCDDNHLTPRERLELFVPVCQALQHAHQKGIIHRDIKPSNVMITLYDGKPVPKVIDFGVAKATEQKLTERTMFTQYGTMVGTLEYMSPEQAEMSALGVDTRSDIYSLGVVLYELLTGSTPLTQKRLKEAAYAEILRMIKEEEPPRPSTRLSDSCEALASISAQRKTEPAKLTKLVRGELDWIVMKSLDKDRNRRYETASGFALDVQRYLADEAVQACPPSTSYRFRKFARRNKRVLTTLGLLALALIAGTVVSAWQAVRATNAETTAVLAELKTHKALDEARDARDDTAKALTDSQEYAKRLREEKLSSDRLRYVSDMRLAQHAGDQNDFERLEELLEFQRPRRTGDIDLRGFEWYYLDRLRLASAAMTLKGHVSQVWGLAYSPDGGQLASAGWDFQVGVWDSATGQQLRKAQGHTFSVQGVAYSPDGRRLASAGNDKTVRIWDPATGQELLKLAGYTAKVLCVDFSSDGRRLVSGCEDGTLKIWDPASGKETLKIKAHNARVLSVAFSPDSRLLASASVDKTVTIWDPATGQQLQTFIGHSNRVFGVAFSPDGLLLASASQDNTVRMWDPASGKELRSLRGHTGPVTSVAFSRDGGKLASGSEDKTVRIWDPATGAELLSLRGHTDSVRALAFSSDNRHLASGGSDHIIRIWDVPESQKARQLSLKGHSKGVWAVAFSPDGRRLASASPNAVKLWDPATGKEVRTLSHTLLENSVKLAGLAFSRDGRRLAAGSRDGTVKIWDPDTGDALLTLVGHSGAVLKLAFSPDDSRLASASADKTIKIWDLHTGQAIKTLSPENGVLSVAFSPDGRLLASSNWGKAVMVWDSVTGQLLYRLDGHTMGVFSVAFSADGRLASASLDNTVKLWDLTTRQEVLTFRGHSLPVECVAFSPNGGRLASASQDKTVRIWNMTTGQELLTLKGHSSQIPSLAFSPDGLLLASASDDKTIRIWDATPRKEAGSNVRAATGK